MGGRITNCDRPGLQIEGHYRYIVLIQQKSVLVRRDGIEYLPIVLNFFLQFLLVVSQTLEALLMGH